MEVQNDRGMCPLASHLLQPVHGLLNAEFQADPGNLADKSFESITQRFSKKAAWLMPDSGLLVDLECDALARTMLAQGTDAVKHLAQPMRLEGAESFIAHQYAPQGLAHGSLLHASSSASRSHLALSCALHHVHSAQLGAARLEENPNRLYRRFLEHQGLQLPAISSSRASRDPRLLPEAWTLIQLRLSLAGRPERNMAKILGAALFETLCPVPPILHALKGLAGLNSYLDQIERVTAKRLDLVIAQAIKLHLDNMPASDMLNACQGIDEGFSLSMAIMQRWLDELFTWIDDGQLGARQQMIQLVKDKARYACGYHGRMKLDRMPFDELMSSDPARFVDALARSVWVVPGQPARSRLVNELISFKGPMFRIFNDTDLHVIRRWITDLEPQSAQVPGGAEPATPVSSTWQENAPLLPLASSRLPGVRTLYHQLINVERFPQVRASAKAFANRWLAQTLANASASDGALPSSRYEIERLRDWYDAKAMGQVDTYRKQSDIEKSRQQVIEEAVSLCPMIFIDGAWLQQWCSPGLLDSPIGALFYQTYSDEIGNGEQHQNHANIYRQLMRAMDIELPEFDQPAFVEWDGFADEDFEVPVFWLCLSLFPRSFLPETLGLNLAMEMSGVGGAYRQARDELRHYGFPTHFVDLHNTIDNVATGHSAMALQAIECFMDDYAQVSGSAETLWQRIWVGYRALRPPQKNLKSWWARNNAYPLNIAESRTLK
ncbi:iron-containing redox enzyme family protein [Pseudomonas sp. Irchel 3A7]|uniref:iron-containing redox enzyme family protein n=1 Tax=Pseudomonas sp. Irchel 3A7 TaxID=2008913 RepID=UPI000BA467E4|nr:iron-containing redox enzyme family protein [Pseudomonas sp. Irchel 3A7]